jgi:cytochrome c5
MQSTTINTDSLTFQMIFRRFRVLGVLILMVASISVANADPAEWRSLFQSYLDTGTASSCNSCHGNNPVRSDPLVISLPDTVAFDVGEFSVEFEGFGNDANYRTWMYQTSLGGMSPTPQIDSSIGNDSVAVENIAFDTNESEITVRACVLHTQTVSRGTGISPTFVEWDCETKTVLREDAPPNMPPAITSSQPSSQDVERNSGPFAFTVITDDDASDVTLSVLSSNASVVNVNSSSAPTFTLSFVGVGTSTINITARDSENLVATQSFDVTVRNRFTLPPIIVIPVTPPLIPSIDPPVLTVNLPPSVALNGVLGGALELIVNDIFTLGVSIRDEQIDSLNYETSSSNPAVATGSFSAPGLLAINANGSGAATITLLVTDAELRSASLSVDVTVSIDNAAPVAVENTFIISEQGVNVLLDVLFNDSDSNGDALSIVLDSTTSTLGNPLELTGNSVSYQLQGVLVTNDFFSYRAEDTSGALSDSVMVTLIPSDQDGDGIVDALDNCSDFPNADQGDLDSDLIGDLCDVDPDGDGAPGISGIPFQSGRQLVEAECLTCHLVGVANAPLFNADAVWDALIQAAGGQPEDLLDSVLNGQGAMPAFSSDYSTQELLQAIRYLSGKEEISSGPGSELIDLDLDGVTDDLDNCPRVPNEDQFDSNGNSLGDACEPLADRDGDGIPFSLDDDDSNAGRLLATYPNTTNRTVFTSANTLRLGRIASAVAESNGSEQIDVALSESSFAQGVSVVFPGVAVMIDSQYGSLIGVINLGAQSVAGEAEVIIQLSSKLPLNSVIRLFDTSGGLWRDFSTDTVNLIASAPATNSGCPISTSANYQAGLAARLSCVRLNVQDGSANDADDAVNSQVELIINIAREVQDDGGPATVVLNPAKSGGGSGGPWILVVLLMANLLLRNGSVLRVMRKKY